MTRYVALLRGINVGRNKQLPMADLRKLLSGLGYDDVKTHLRSGNAVFGSAETEPAKLQTQIETAIADQLGLNVKCLVRSRDEWRAVVDGHPLTELADNGSRMMALFLSANPDPALLAEHDPVALDPDHLRLGDRVIYHWCPNGLLEAPPVGPYVEKNLKLTVTARNWNTVAKLGELLAD
jgi:uncharacterized protein (DUF1697 family)